MKSVVRSCSACLRWAASFIAASLTACGGEAWAGPPFFSNDPDPPDLGQWEIILPSTYSRSSGAATSGEWTTFDFNYGYDARTQLSAGLPVSFLREPNQRRQSGFGDVFLEYKRRFGVDPDAGYFGIDPAVAFPTGDSNRGLGAGRTTAAFPLLYQKQGGKWTAYADTRYK